LSQSGFERRFGSGECRVERLAKIRWPEVPRCPRLQGNKFWRRGTAIKCPSCRLSARILPGTPFQDAHLPLAPWFRAMRFAVTPKLGASAMGLQRALGASHSAAWLIQRKPRRAMIRSGRESLGELD
jgi:hypothetical protein